MDATIHKIPELIFKQFNQSITDIEEKELNEWIKSSDKNKERYNEIIDADNLSASLKRYFTYDVDRAKKNIQEKITPKKGSKPKFLSIIKYAAIIIPLLTASYFTLKNLLSPPPENLFAMEAFDVMPGSKIAVLTLHNGEEVKLGEHSAANEIKIDNQTTAIDQDFSLAYNEIADSLVNTASNTVFVPMGGEYKLILSDGTKVWINANSQITFPVQFERNIRKVQVQGEAYFEVAHNPQKPFVVECANYAIEVLGTKFNVMNYTDDEHSVTTLVEGKVKIEDNASAQSMVLTPGEQVELSYKTSIYSVNKVEAAHYIAWKDGLFSFQSASLDGIMRTLSRWYACDFYFDDKSLENLHFTGTLDKHQNLKTLLRLISETCSVDFSVTKENDIIISSK